MRVLICELAKATGFSVASVTRIFNGRPHLLSDKTKQQILFTAKELGYLPNLVGRSLHSARVKTIGLVVDTTANPFPPIAIRAIQNTLQQINAFRIVINVVYDTSDEACTVEEMIIPVIDGTTFVQSSQARQSPTLDMANNPYIPFHRLMGSSVNNTIALGGAYKTRLGHRRIALINGPDK